MATANDLNISQAGIVAFDGIATFSGRTINGGTGVTVINGNGVSGDPTISLTGGGSAVEHLTGTTGGQLNPTANNFNLLAGTVAAGTTPVAISGSVSTLTTNIQISQAIAAADATKIGLSNFDSSIFAVAATGFVTLSSTGVGKTITGNSGGAISPTANNWNTVGTGSITIVGSGSTLTSQLTGLTNHAIQIGAGTATLTQLGAGTTGQILQTNTTADPTWSTATYPSTAGASGNYIKSDGTNFSSVAPTQFNTITTQSFTASGSFTFTPTSGNVFTIVELVAGGGGSGGVAATTGNISISQSGGGGGYARFILTAAQVGASLSGSVGIGGSAGSAGNNNGTAGGNTTLATTSAWTVNGGGLGLGNTAGAAITINGAAGGTVTTGTGTILNTTSGGPGGTGNGTAASWIYGGFGGSSLLGPGGRNSAASIVNTVTAGQAGVGPGGGASGAISFGTNSAAAGAAGATGIAIFTEFLKV